MGKAPVKNYPSAFMMSTEGRAFTSSDPKGFFFKPNRRLAEKPSITIRVLLSRETFSVFRGKERQYG
jgi:hypothetical protein